MAFAGLTCILWSCWLKVGRGWRRVGWVLWVEPSVDGCSCMAVRCWSRSLRVLVGRSVVRWFCISNSWRALTLVVFSRWDQHSLISFNFISTTDRNSGCSWISSSPSYTYKCNIIHERVTALTLNLHPCQFMPMCVCLRWKGIKVKRVSASSEPWLKSSPLKKGAITHTHCLSLSASVCNVSFFPAETH